MRSSGADGDGAGGTAVAASAAAAELLPLALPTLSSMLRLSVLSCAGAVVTGSLSFTLEVSSSTHAASTPEQAKTTRDSMCAGTPKVRRATSETMPPSAGPRTMPREAADDTVASALEVAVDQMEGAEEMLEAYRRQGAQTDHENMARIAYLGGAAQREVTRSVPDLETAIFLMSLAAPAGPVADPSANDVAVLDKEIRRYVEKQTPGRRLRKMDNKKMRKLIATMRARAEVALHETVAAD